MTTTLPEGTAAAPGAGGRLWLGDGAGRVGEGVAAATVAVGVGAAEIDGEDDAGVGADAVWPELHALRRMATRTCRRAVVGILLLSAACAAAPRHTSAPIVPSTAAPTVSTPAAPSPVSATSSPVSSPSSPAPASPMVQTVTLGISVKGRPITAVERGDPAAPRRLVVVGCIHGNEPA